MKSKLFGILFATLLGVFAHVELASAEPEETPVREKTVTTYWVIEYPVVVETQELVTPDSTALVEKQHTVIPGDTLSQIAENYLGSMDLYPQIAQKNSLENPDLIFPGQTLLIETHFNTEAVYRTVTRVEMRQEVIPFVTTISEETSLGHDHDDSEDVENHLSSTVDEKLKLIETLRSQDVMRDAQTTLASPAAACMLKLQLCDRSPLVTADQVSLPLEEETYATAQLPPTLPPPESQPPPEPSLTPVETWAWPVVAPLSDYFGTCGHPLRKGCHTGIDIDLWSYQNTGTHAQITTSKSGLVTVTYCETYSFGCRIEIDHGDGYSSMYAHLSAFHVTVGQTVTQGEVIGISGLTGTTTGEHLHFEIHLHGVPQNPLEYLP